MRVLGLILLTLAFACGDDDGNDAGLAPDGGMDAQRDVGAGRDGGSDAGSDGGPGADSSTDAPPSDATLDAGGSDAGPPLLQMPQTPFTADGFSPPAIAPRGAEECIWIEPSEAGSIATRLNGAGAGDTFCLRSGEIYDVGNIQLQNIVGTPDAYVTVVTPDNAPPASLRVTQYRSFGFDLNTNVSFFELNNIELVGSGGEGAGGGMVPGNEFTASGVKGGTGGLVHHIRLYNLHIRDFVGGGINIGDATHFDIRGNVIHGNAYWSGNMESGISTFTFRNDAYPGFDADPGYVNFDGVAYANVFTHNIVFDNENRVGQFYNPGDTHPLPSDGNGIILDRHDDEGYTGNFLVRQNVIYNNGGQGVQVLGTNDATVVENTVIYNGTNWWDTQTLTLQAGAAEISLDSNSERTIVARNLLWAAAIDTTLGNGDHHVQLLRVNTADRDMTVCGQWGGQFTGEAKVFAYLQTCMSRVEDNAFVTVDNAFHFIGAGAGGASTGNTNEMSNPGLVEGAMADPLVRDYRIERSSRAFMRGVGAIDFVR